MVLHTRIPIGHNWIRACGPKDHEPSAQIVCALSPIQEKAATEVAANKFMVEIRGFEPLTS